MSGNSFFALPGSAPSKRERFSLRGRFCLILLLSAIALGGFRVHFTGLGQMDQAKLSGLKRSGSLSGFIYRSTWNVEDKMVFVNSGFKALADVSGLEPEQLSEIEAGAFVNVTHYYIYEAEPPRNPGVFDYRRYLLSRGVTYCLKIFSDGIEKTPLDRDNAFPGVLHLPGAFVRYHTGRILRNCLGEGPAEVVGAIMTGDTGSLDGEVKNVFRTGGISHLMAVSGMHVTFILLPFRALVKNRKTGFRLRQILLIFPLAAFLLVADFSYSVIRASAAAVFGYVCAILSRPYDRLNALFLSAAAQIFINPYAVFSAGFLMSYAAVAGLVFIAPSVTELFLSLRYKERKDVKKLSVINLRSLAAGISVNLALLPLSVYLYGGFSAAGLLTTVYASPLAAAVCLLGYVLTVCGALSPLYILRPLAWVTGYLLKGICAVLNLVALAGSRLPAPFGYVSVPVSFRWIVFAACALAAVLLSPLREKIREGIVRVRSRENGRRRLRIIAALGTIAVAASVTVYVAEKPLIEALVIDVGQGNAMLVKADGYAGLIDTGGGNTDIREVAEAQGIDRLDFVALTHGHSDHAGGLDALLDELSPARLYISRDSSSGLREAGEKAEAAGWEVVNVDGGDAAALGRVTMSFAVSDSFFGGRSDADENNSSLCVTFSCAYGSITVTGDLQREGEEALCRSKALKDVDVLVVPHHGSASGSGVNLLSLTSPEYAIISVGRSNGYGHPSPETLDRLKECGASVFRTDLGGGICVRIGRPGLFRRKRIKIWQTV